MIDPSILKDFIPLNALHGDSLQEIAAACGVVNLHTGQVGFRQGDKDGDIIYLLEGKLALGSADKQEERQITAGSEEARYALAKLNPRPYTGTALAPASLARIDPQLLDRLLTRDQAMDYEVVEYEGGDPEWMVQVLANPAFQKLDPSNFNGLFMKFESLPVKASQAIVRQGEPGDYYYLIRSGRAQVSRQVAGGRTVVLADIGPGEGFGEEALLSGAPRNATVTMLSDGELMRLAARDFAPLLKEPLVKWVNHRQAMELLKAGGVMIDVRLEDEHRTGAPPGSVNIPLYLLRLKSRQLDTQRRYVVCCQSGSRSSVAAFLLSQRGFDVYALQGGLEGLGRAA